MDIQTGEQDIQVRYGIACKVVEPSLLSRPTVFMSVSKHSTIIVKRKQIYNMCIRTYIICRHTHKGAYLAYEIVRVWLVFSCYSSIILELHTTLSIRTWPPNIRSCYRVNRDGEDDSPRASTRLLKEGGIIPPMGSKWGGNFLTKGEAQ